MRYGADHKQQSRERVIAEAAKAIRAEGPYGVSVAGVMGAAGLTHGAFYAHFESREALIAAGIEQMFKEGRARIRNEVDQGEAPAKALASYIGYYLSRSHRDTRTSGCPLPFLAADAPRLTGELQARYAAGAASLTTTLAELLRQMDKPHPESLASSVLAEMVGAVSLARAEPDADRAWTILKSSKAALKDRLGLEDLK